MDETQNETAKASSESLGFFSPHRRRHLRSETYRTLLRIFSQCYDDSFASQNLDRNVNTENGSNGLWLRTEEQEGSQSVELAGSDRLEPKNPGSEKVTEVNMDSDDNGSQDKRDSEEMAIYQIEELMGFEESENLLDQKDVNMGLGPEQMIMDELEHIVKGNEESGCEDNLKPLRTLSLENQSCVDEVGSPNDQREHVELQQVHMTKIGDASQMLSCLNDIMMDRGAAPRTNYADKLSSLNVDPIRQQEVTKLNSVSAIGSNGSTIPALRDIDKEESHAQVMCSNFNFPSEDNTVSDIFCSGNELKVDHEMKLNNSELATSICDGNMVDSTNPMTKDIDMEEGEISGGYITDDISMDMLLRDTEIPDKKLTKEPVNELSSETSFFLVDRLDNTNSFVGLRGSDRNKTDYTLEIVLHEGTLGDEACTNDSMPKTLSVEKIDSDGNNNLVVPVNIMEGDATGHNKTSTETEVHPKKKRGPQTKEKRANKKKKERKRRAEKNKQLGVRRLKLHTIAKPKSKPKPVNYCRHYVYGRCQEGEKCKFSHDVVPLTKSKPCCHFARHSCMKGDDCPFDHQLSKYPCSNFASKGFCSRGDDCMFSHKTLPNEVAMASSSAVDPETKLAALIGNITPQKQQNNEGDSKKSFSTLPFSTLLHSRKSTDKSPTETLLKKTQPVSKGTSFLSVGIRQQILSPNGDGDAKAGKSGSVKNSNEVLNRTPSRVAPKGINFLSFGRVQRDDLSGSKLASSSSNGDNGAKLSTLDNSNVPSQTILAPSTDSTIKGIQPLVAPKGINFLSFGRAQRDDLSGSKLTSSSSNGENGVKLSRWGNSNISIQTSSALSLDSMVKETQPVVAPKGINFLSFGKASTDDSSSKGKAKLLSECDSGTGSCVKLQENALDKPQQPSTISLPLPSSTVSPVQSLDHSASKIYKESPHLAQKALFSTLAFAAKYECQTKSNQPTKDLAVGTDITKEPINNGTTGGSQNNLVKASKLLEFLSIIGSKSKQ